MSTTDWQTVLVDLLNTTPVVDGAATDLLADAATARSWLRAHGGGPTDELDGVRRVRDDLQRVVWGQCEREVLDGYLSGVRQVPHIGADGLAWSFDGADWTARVVLAWGAIESEAPGRLRPCANDECRLFLLDRSRGGTGRWCSMSGCGNRMKARRHYQRTAIGRSEPGNQGDDVT
jgi:CGNR zinc finger/Putative stress-induced transcription regulator